MITLAELIKNKLEIVDYGNILFEWNSKMHFLNAIIRSKDAIFHDWGYIFFLIQNDISYSSNKKKKAKKKKA